MAKKNNTHTHEKDENDENPKARKLNLITNGWFISYLFSFGYASLCQESNKVNFDLATIGKW